MTKCEQVRPYLPAFAARSLEGSERLQVEQHLGHCPACEAGLARTRKLQSLLSLKRHEKPDELFIRNFLPEFHRRLFAQVAQSQSQSFWSRLKQVFVPAEGQGMLWPSVSLGAVTALVAVSFYFAHISVQEPVSNQVASRSEKLAPAVAENGPSVIEVATGMNQLVLDDTSSRSIYVLDRLSYEPLMHGPSVLQF